MKQPLNTNDYAKLSVENLLDIISDKFHKEIQETFDTVNLQLKIAHKLEPLEEELEFALVMVGEIEKKFTEHIEKEEILLFPILGVTKKRTGVYGEENDTEEFISDLKSEHDILKTQFSQIRKATNQYTCEPSSTPSHKLAYAQLNDLEQDINRLFFVEEEYLFPRVLRVQHK
ncbi:MAG TPA: hemerythrin domain-containing protein [Bacteroidia bacterium]|nr:hemerythrin domain-containing protein [Bacteroidia bacterium]